MNFNFISNILLEKRCYDYNAWRIEFIVNELERIDKNQPNLDILFPEKNKFDEIKSDSFIVSHVFVPSVSGVKIVEETFGIELPSDFIEFYKQFNEAVILGLNPIVVLSPEEIIKVSNELREAQGVHKDLPRHVIRFAWIGTDQYFLLRFCPDAKNWDVMFSSYSLASDTELQNKTAWTKPCDKSFGDWLRRIIETDGAPLDPLDPDEGDFLTKRIS